MNLFMFIVLSCCEVATPDHAAYFSHGEFLNCAEALPGFSGAQTTADHDMSFMTPGPPTRELMLLGEKFGREGVRGNDESRSPNSCLPATCEVEPSVLCTRTRKGAGEESGGCL